MVRPPTSLRHSPSGALAGIIGDDWPANSVDVRAEMLAYQVVGMEVDGVRHQITPSCLRVFDFGDDGVLGVYNAWVRFSAAGQHTLKIVTRQVREFYFVYPFDFFGIPDPLGLDGRRVFVRGEVVGDSPFDGQIIHDYVLNVQ